MKWFNLNGIFKEISKIRWPKKDELATNSVQVVIFTTFFVLFFALCLALISWILNIVGVI